LCRRAKQEYSASFGNFVFRNVEPATAAVGWAKARSAVPTIFPIRPQMRGHASLWPPYGSVNVKPLLFAHPRNRPGWPGPSAGHVANVELIRKAYNSRQLCMGAA